MNDNIDLTKILEGCPKGTELYSPLFGIVRFNKISDSDHPIIVEAKNDQYYCYSFKFSAKGSYYNFFDDAECLLFPSKDQRDWSKFERFWDKPKVEKFDPKSFQPFDKVLAKDDVSSWIPTFFGYLIDPANDFYTDKEVAVCNDYAYKQVIPYNDDTKHLVGKGDDCPEYYKWWEE